MDNIKFGLLKSKILAKVTELYKSEEMDVIKNILKEILKEKNFKDMYLFYEEFENKHIADEKVAEQYINELEKELKTKMDKLGDFCNKMNNFIGEMEVPTHPVYYMLDGLYIDYDFANLDKKIENKNNLIKFLLSPKSHIEIHESVANEKLLMNVLCSNFNFYYKDKLNEEETKIFKNIMSLNETKLSEDFKILKEDTITKINTLISENENKDIISSLKQVKTEIEDNKFIPDRVNYYKLYDLNKNL